MLINFEDKYHKLEIKSFLAFNPSSVKLLPFEHFAEKVLLYTQLLASAFAEKATAAVAI